MTSLLLAALLQDVVPPKGWSRRVDEATKATVLTPPGAGLESQFLIYPPARAALGPGQDFHALMLAQFATAGALEAATSGASGRFRWTRATFRPSVGGELRVALYTASSGDAHEAAVFLAPEKLFAEHLGTVDALLCAEPAGPQIHGLVFPPLGSWTRKDVALSPPPPGPLRPAWDYVLHVLPTRPLQGSHWQSHRTLHDEIVKSSGLRDPVAAILEPNGPGVFIKSSTAGRDDAGAVRPLTLYSARSENGLEAVLVVNQEDPAAIGDLLGRARPKAPPKDAAKTKVVEAWRRADRVPAIERGASPGSFQYERIWLRADGVADFSTTYPEGYAASTVPAKLDATLLNGRVGSWKAAGDAVRVTRRVGAAPEVYLRDGAALRLGAQVWQPMPAVDGLKLDGVWALSPDARIEFTPDGRFRDEGVLNHVGALPVLKHAGAKDVYWARPPAACAGTYELRDFTLLLKLDGGGSFATDFSTLGADPKDLRGLLLGTQVLRKE